VKLIYYRLITCKVRYFKPLFVIILMMIMAYSYENLFTYYNFELWIFISFKL